MKAFTPTVISTLTNLHVVKVISQCEFDFFILIVELGYDMRNVYIKLENILSTSYISYEL